MRSDIAETATDLDISVDSYSPGDGVTRYRFGPPNEPTDYFAMPHPYTTVLGARDARTFLSGVAAGRDLMLRRLQEASA